MRHLAVLAVLSLSGCLGPAPTGSETDDPGEQPFVVGPEGGTASFGGAVIAIPEGALEEPIEIRLIETEEEPPEPYLGLSRIWRAEPEGLVFAEPVTIRLPIDADAVDAVDSGDLVPNFYWAEAEEGEPTRIEPALLNDGSTELRADVTRLSSGFIAALPSVSVVEDALYPPADVLFIIDNSCSMFEEQNAIANNIGTMISTLQASTIDWHLGVVSTDMTNTQQHAGKLQQAGGNSWVDASTAQPETAFAQMAIMGTGGDFEEKGRAAAYTMVEVKPDIPRNQGFLREDATLTFVFVSDEEDQSGSIPIPRPEFREWMETKKERPEDVVAHGIIDPPGVPCPQGDTDGVEYERYATWTGGQVFNLCQPDWAPYFEAIATQLLDSARVRLDEPADEILEVAITEDGAETVLTDADWTYDADLQTVYLAPGIATTALESMRVDYRPE
jgi:hypothetical protein